MLHKPRCAQVPGPWLFPAPVPRPVPVAIGAPPRERRSGAHAAQHVDRRLIHAAAAAAGIAAVVLVRVRQALAGQRLPELHLEHFHTTGQTSEFKELQTF